MIYYDDLLAVAERIFWFGTPEEILEFPKRFLTYAMTKHQRGLPIVLVIRVLSSLHQRFNIPCTPPVEARPVLWF